MIPADFEPADDWAPTIPQVGVAAVLTVIGFAVAVWWWLR